MIGDLLLMFGVYSIGPILLLGLWCEGLKRLSRWHVRRLRAGNPKVARRPGGRLLGEGRR
jgi:hypothetical protein